MRSLGDADVVAAAAGVVEDDAAWKILSMAVGLFSAKHKMQESLSFQLLL